jgi:hypothetical protein
MRGNYTNLMDISDYLKLKNSNIKFNHISDTYLSYSIGDNQYEITFKNNQYIIEMYIHEDDEEFYATYFANSIQKVLNYI